MNIKNIIKKFKQAINEENAAAMAEYALILALVTLTVATVVTTLGARICQAISNATGVIPT